MKPRRTPNFHARIRVTLKQREFDPEAETVTKSLRELGFVITKARVSKTYDLILQARTKKEAERLAKSACLKLLANPTKDDFEFEVSEIDSV
jgi:phosphoribosylformylglycinamidine synthase subunit PurS